nr:sulfite exporter TauE/SafE family protein [uncultured Desulfobulbus sp.]
MPTLSLIGTGLLLGLATGPSCLASCAPVVVPVLLCTTAPSVHRRFAWPMLSSLLFGRLLAYILVGALAGVSGRSLQVINADLVPWLSLVLALILLAHGLGLLRNFMCCTVGRLGGFASPFILGVLTGLSLCPPFVVAVSWVWGQEMGPLPGMLFFFAFFGGTSMYLLPLGFGGYLAQGPSFVRLGRLLSVCSGLFFLLQFFLTVRGKIWISPG